MAEESKEQGMGVVVAKLSIVFFHNGKYAIESQEAYVENRATHERVALAPCPVLLPGTELDEAAADIRAHVEARLCDRMGIINANSSARKSREKRKITFSEKV